LRSDGPALRKVVVAILAGATFAGCTLDLVNLPVSASIVVVHGVLSARDSVHWILVERTLTGEVPTSRIYVGDGLGNPNAIDASEPILSDGGNPEQNALVQVVLPDGTVRTVPEWTTTHPLNHGAGVYRFVYPRASLVPGGRYELRIVTQRGEVVTAETVIPAVPTTFAPVAESFDRANDLLSLSWPASAAARAYEVRIEGPHGPWLAITEGTSVTVDGDLRNLDTEAFTRVLIPGFRQAVTVSAVDENLYEYYRTVSDGFTGSGIVNRVQGGLGVFGSHVMLERRLLDVTAPATRPIEGTYDLLEQEPGYYYGGATDARVVSVYVESPGANPSQADAITARFTRTFGTTPGAAAGSLADGTLTLHFLANQTLVDTLDRFTGTMRGDTLVGNFSKGAPARYLRRAP
jgi:hypothetical protein